MRASRWVAFVVFAACVPVAACGGAIAPTGGEGDGGGGSGSSSSSGSGGSSSGVVGGSSSSGSGGIGSSTSGSSGGISSGGSTSSGSGSGSSGGVTVDAAFGCTNGVPPPMTGSAACDACIEASCGAPWCACAGDSSLDDAGNPQGCIGYVDCVQVCLFPPPNAGVDAGTIQQCAQQCAPAYSQQQVQEGDALLGCLASNCVTPATCGQ